MLALCQTSRGGLARVGCGRRAKWHGCCWAFLLRPGARICDWRGDLPPAWGRDDELAGPHRSLPVAVVGRDGAPGWRFQFAVAHSEVTEVPTQLMLVAYAAPRGSVAASLRERTWRFIARLKAPAWS